MEIALIANAGDGSISTVRLDREPEPRLTVIATHEGLPGCGTFAVDRRGGLVHAAVKGEQPAIVTLRLDRASGELTEIGRREVDDSQTYLEVARGGSYLLGASYSGGTGRVWPVRDGQVGEPVAEVSYRNLHCVVTDDHFVWFVSLGEDLIAQYRLGADGRLEPQRPTELWAPEGSGPRHLVLGERSAWLVTEFSGEVMRWALREGTLRPREAVRFVDPDAGLAHSRFGADPRADHLIWGADIGIAAAGGRKFVLASERTTSTMAVLPLDADGYLRSGPVSWTPLPTQPRGFRVSDDKRFVIAVGERDTRAQLLEMTADGELADHGSVEIGQGANWVRFV